MKVGRIMHENITTGQKLGMVWWLHVCINAELVDIGCRCWFDFKPWQAQTFLLYWSSLAQRQCISATWSRKQSNLVYFNGISTRWCSVPIANPFFILTGYFLPTRCPTSNGHQGHENLAVQSNTPSNTSSPFIGRSAPMSLVKYCFCSVQMCIKQVLCSYWELFFSENSDYITIS